MSTAASPPRSIEKVLFSHILLATDFSEPSRRTVAHAMVLARKYGSEILLVHALTPKTQRPTPLPPVVRELDLERTAADQQLAQLASDVHLKNHPHRVTIEEGAVWDALDAVITREGIDLLVLGTHGRSGLKKLILGSVAEEVLRRASCPTLTVGPHTQPPSSDEAGFRAILYVTDFGPASAAAFPYALALAEDYRARFVLLHIMEPSSVLDIGPGAFVPGESVARELVEWQARAQAENLNKLKGLLPINANLACEPEYVVERAFLPDGIMDTATSHSADLIVMGVPGGHSPRLTAHIPGELIHEVICHAKCPVLTVRG